MKINSLKYWKEDVKLSRPYEIAFRRIDSVALFFVSIQSGSHTGYGAGSPEPYVTGESFDDSLTALEKMQGENLQNVDDLERYVKKQMTRCPAAAAALDMAVWDLKGKYQNVATCELLGGKIKDGLPTSITIGIKNVEETLAEAKEYWGRGFTILKVKLGKNLEEDRERIAKLNEHRPRITLIRVDANQGYTVEEFSSLIKKWEGIEFYEQPVPVADTAKLAQLSENEKDLVAVDEALLSPSDAEKWAHSSVAGIFNIKLMKCGGITNGKEIASIARQNGIRLMWGCMDESRLSISAALHVALTFENTEYLDLDGHLDLANDPFQGGFQLKDGRLYLSDRPGLGVDY